MARTDRRPTTPTPEEAALDALARALAPRVAKLLRAAENPDAELDELLARAGYEREEGTS